MAFLFNFAGCTSIAPRGFDIERPTEWMQSQGFRQQFFEFSDFWIASSIKKPTDEDTSDVLAIYIEGDGASWPSLYTPPPDPTPLKPVALWLAAQDPSYHTIYLGRPCQYAHIGQRECSTAYWTTHRFSASVIAAYDRLIEHLKAVHGARAIRLVGYSGGGVIAALLATRRSDVVQLITVAAPLSVRSWTTHHKITPLHGSLDPVGAGRPHQNTLTRVHYVGKNDRVVPFSILAEYEEKVDTGAVVFEVPDFGHECCWAEKWRHLLELALTGR